MKKYKFGFIVEGLDFDYLQMAFDSCDSEFETIIWIGNNKFLALSNRSECSNINWLAKWTNINSLCITKIGI